MPSTAKADSAIVRRLLSWFATTARDLPWRRTHDPYAIWVSEIMLQQTQVKTVIPYFERWMRALPTIHALARAKPERIHKLWEGLGYYTRVRNLQKAARVIVAEHDGKFPTNFDAVLALPGIGRYTAGAICSIAFNQPAPILDGNVIRVLTRVFAIPGNPKDTKINARLWVLAEMLVRTAGLALNSAPRTPHSALNESLMELGALICTPRDPRCDACPVRVHCVARRQNRVADFPALPRRARATQRRFVAFILRRGNRYLVRQRPAGVVNAHLWEFPNLELTNGTDPHTAFQLLFGSPTKSSTPNIRRPPDTLAFSLQPLAFSSLGSIKHTITRYRITLDVFQVAAPGTRLPARLSDRWLTRPALRRLPFTSAHKKILNAKL